MNHNNSFPFKRRRSGCASSESDDFRTKTRGSDNDSIDSVWHPTPASSTQHQLTWRKKKILLIINWDVSELSVSGIWAMHWLFKSNASTESTPGSSGLLVRTHARTHAQAMSICYADSSLLVGYLLIAFLHSEKPLKSLKLTALGGCTQSCLTCTQCVLFMTSKSVVLHISQKN